MISQQTFRTMALAFPDTVELPHFDKASFRHKKKIFATLWEKENKAMLKLPLSDQFVFCSYDKNSFYPVPGAWGKGGATFVELAVVDKKILAEALAIAYATLQKK